MIRYGMSSESDSTASLPGSGVKFLKTRWTVVLAAGRSSTPEGTAALESLCRAYWYPVYAFVRRYGRSPAEAEDLTQGFFAHLLRRDWLAGVSPEKGRFRTYLLRCLTHYLTNEWRKEHCAQRRPVGGLIPLETGEAETRYVHEPLDEETPERVFQREWVATLIGLVKARLQAECERDGKRSLYDKLEPHLGDRADHGFHAGAAANLGMSEGALRVALHRLRKRFGEILRETVAETVTSPAEVDDEIRNLFSAWG